MAPAGQPICSPAAPNDESSGELGTALLVSTCDRGLRLIETDWDRSWEWAHGIGA